MTARRRDGSRIVPKVVPIAIAFLLVGVGIGVTEGCVVTSDPTITSDNVCSPSFNEPEASPAYGSIGCYDPTTTTGTTFTAQIPMETCELAQAFDGRVFVDGATTNTLQIVIAPSGSNIRMVDVVLPLAGFASGCHVIDLLASSQFGFDGRQPVDPTDVTEIEWTIWVGTCTGQSISCP